MGISFLKKFVQRVAYEKIKLKDGKDVEIYENLDFVNCDWHSPDDLTTPKGLLKSLLVGTSGMLPKSFFARNSDMILVSIVGLCRAYMFVPFNEQGMAVEGEGIWIASEERFTFINHSFDGSALGETSFECFLCHDNFEVLPGSSNLIGNSEWWIILSFDVHGSGEGSRVEPSDGMCLVSTDEDSSTLDMTFA